MSDEVSPDTQPRSRLGWLFLALPVCELLLFGLWGYANYYWTKPVGVIIALVALAAAVIAIVAVIGLRARRRVLAIAGVVGITAVVIVASVFLSFVSPVPKQARIEQIAEQADFTVMLPSETRIAAKDEDGYAPSSDLSESGEFTLDYDRFNLWERRSDSVMTAEQLESYIGLDMQPDPKSQTVIIVDDKDEPTVGGRPALAVTWHEAMDSKQGGSGRILIFQLDGLVVRMSSDATDDEGLSVDEMVRIAETFEPVE